MTEKAAVTFLPAHSGDGYGFGGGAILTIGSFSFQFGEDREAKKIAAEIASKWNGDDVAVEKAAAQKWRDEVGRLAARRDTLVDESAKLRSALESITALAKDKTPFVDLFFRAVVIARQAIGDGTKS